MIIKQENLQVHTACPHISKYSSKQKDLSFICGHWHAIFDTRSSQDKKWNILKKKCPRTEIIALTSPFLTYFISFLSIFFKDLPHSLYFLMAVYNIVAKKWCKTHLAGRNRRNSIFYQIQRFVQQLFLCF